MDVSNNPLDSTEFLERLRADWAKQCNLMLPEGVRIDTAALRRRASNVSPPSTRPRQPRDHQTRWAQHPQCDQPAHRHGQPVPDGHPQTDGRPDRLLGQFKEQARKELDTAMSRFRESLCSIASP